jgi:hypothetical protein
VHFGETKKIDLDVSNVLRIKISITSSTSNSGHIAIGDPRFA